VKIPAAGTSAWKFTTTSLLCFRSRLLRLTKKITVFTNLQTTQNCSNDACDDVGAVIEVVDGVCAEVVVTEVEVLLM